jgi:hypothetical protein
MDHLYAIETSFGLDHAEWLPAATVLAPNISRLRSPIGTNPPPIDMAAGGAAAGSGLRSESMAVDTGIRDDSGLCSDAGGGMEASEAALSFRYRAASLASMTTARIVGSGGRWSSIHNTPPTGSSLLDSAATVEVNLLRPGHASELTVVVYQAEEVFLTLRQKYFRLQPYRLGPPPATVGSPNQQRLGLVRSWRVVTLPFPGRW